MIRLDDLQEAIAECEGQKNPNANTCMMLAAFYTIKRELFGETEQPPVYSYAAEPERRAEGITYTSDSEFGQIVTGKDPERVMEIIDEMLGIIQGMSPRLYTAVLQKIAD